VIKVCPLLTLGDINKDNIHEEQVVKYGKKGPKHKAQANINRQRAIKDKISALEIQRGIHYQYSRYIFVKWAKAKALLRDNEEDLIQQANKRPPKIQQENRADPDEPQGELVGKVLQGQERCTFGSYR